MLQHRVTCDDNMTAGDNHPEELGAPLKKVLGDSLLLFCRKYGKSRQWRALTAIYVRRQSPYPAPPRTQFFQLTIGKFNYAVRRVSADSMNRIGRSLSQPLKTVLME